MMMTFEESMARTKSVCNLSLAALHERMKKWRTVDKLRAFQTWFEPSASLSKSIDEYVNRLESEIDELKAIEEDLDRRHDKLNALPSWSTVDYGNGRKEIIVHKGMLPNFEETSTDEAEALKMLEEYYAKSA